MPTQRSPATTLSAARALVNDLYEPKAAIYWADFLLTMTVGYAAGLVYLQPNLPLGLQMLALPIAVVALYRLGSFMHEVVHLKQHQMPVFRFTWNLLAGIPLLTPTFFYVTHLTHHNTHLYGTADDGEYLPLAHGSRRDIALFLLQIVLQPIGVFIRFLLAPLSFLHPRLRQWTLERASSFVINFRHRRAIPADAPRAAWAMVDLACSMRAWAIFALIYLGLESWMHIPKLYSIAVLILVLNHTRTLGAHLYRNRGPRMTHEQQLLDSTNIRGGWLTEALCPLGLRYHALHHLFPSIPYHNLGRAHRRLMQHLPANASYREVEFPTFIAVMREFFRYRRENRRGAGLGWHARPLSRSA